jgi:hypothetical protein
VDHWAELLHARALAALGREEEAGAALIAARSRLLALAASLPGDEDRRMLLAVPVHARIVSWLDATMPSAACWTCRSSDNLRCGGRGWPRSVQMGTTRSQSKNTTTTRSKSGTASGSKAPAKKTSRASRPAKTITLDMPGELRQLAQFRGRWTPLEPQLAYAFHAQHGDPECDTRGTGTRASDTFKGAMDWARTMDAHRQDPGFNPSLVRWFFDCLTDLGHLLSGRSAGGTPSQNSELDDAEHAAEGLLRTTTRRLGRAAGHHLGWTSALDTADTPEETLDPRISRLRQLASLIRNWLSNPSSAPPLAGYHITAQTAEELDQAALALDDAIARRPARRQVDRDSPEINIAEGRLYFVMRSIWDELAEARQDKKTALLLSVTHALVRGLNLHRNRRAGGKTTSGAAEDQAPITVQSGKVS